MDPTFGTMKVVLHLFVCASLAFAQNCPSDVAPVKCGADEMSCYGGSDYNGCIQPDFCYPSKGGKYMSNLTFQTQK